MSLQKAIVEWALAQAGPILEAVRAEAPQGPTRQLEMFGSPGSGTTLKASLFSRVTGRVEGATIEIRSPLRYSVIVKEGHAEIVPVTAQVLHWVDENGEDVWAMRTSAVPPNPYPDRGWERVREAVRADLRKRLVEAATKELLDRARKEGLKVL